MYRLKRNAALSSSLEAEFEKEGQKALLFSMVAAILSIVDAADRKIALAGISIDLKEQFLLNGAFCGLALVYGVSALTTGLRLYGVGWPRQYEAFYKRYIYRRRNRAGIRYRPSWVKMEVRLICAVFDTAYMFTSLLILPIYAYGVIATWPDLFRLVTLLFSKLF
ncbi:hypothetical protein [Agrobacterium sp. RS6]|uniref:hypothetical protein n=1 Tax=Agrobacterium sp. RS6 TaxID=2489001 RepID=UPI000FDCF92D|nr:hypothetical protein [Agrobacterium sp. RS6]